jgi:hypothetical protein
MFDAERGWVLRIWCSKCGIEALAACYTSYPLHDAKASVKPSYWAMKVGGVDWISYHREYLPTGGPFKWRRWSKGGHLERRYESIQFRPSLEPEWTVTDDLPECGK